MVLINGEIMVEEIINIYKNQIITLEKKIEFFEKIIENQEQLKKDLEKQNQLIESHYEILNIVMSNKFIKANGLLRNLQIHTLEMFKFIDQICKKYEIVYWLDFGTLLGAIRHEGFIPWDDEIDIAMPRKDYEKFLTILPDEIQRFEGLANKLIIRKGNSIFKNPKLDSDSPSPGLQFMNRMPHTTLEIHPIEYIKFDDENPDLAVYSIQFKKIREDFKKKYINGDCSFIDGFRDASNKMNVVSEKTNFMACAVDGASRNIFCANHVFPLKKCKFEDCEVNIPNNPINYLATAYNGNIMDIPKNIKHHKFLDDIKEKTRGKDLEEIYQEEIYYWKNINKNF